MFPVVVMIIHRAVYAAHALCCTRVLVALVFELQKRKTEAISKMIPWRIREVTGNFIVLLRPLCPSMDNGQRELLHPYMENRTRFPSQPAFSCNFTAVAYCYLAQNRSVALSKTNQIARLCWNLMYIWTNSEIHSTSTSGGGVVYKYQQAQQQSPMVPQAQHIRSVNDTVVDDVQIVGDGRASSWVGYLHIVNSAANTPSHGC